ncbi:hypothetical protein [Hymenobacter jeollabukensis]|uniref:Uncharacterized protein n=1 Tax=Hymenobacter jeollabukensis TaxID=2025313 RepID=A0A5R8WRV3_9BACT|nr:hypothetical protein [Hymenobacter jeollabukensis]TLM93913.1 hypothetical protein FDY95_07725 [Hymenobacter jeollabukensis]
MAYSVNLLTSVAECDVLLDQAAADLKRLNNRAANIDYARDASSDVATEIQAEMAGLDAEIDSLTDLVPTLAAGTKVRKQKEADLRHATTRRADLTDRQEARGPVALLTRERQQAETTARITELNDFIAAVEARKTAL